MGPKWLIWCSATAGDEAGLERLVSFANSFKKTATEKLYALKLAGTACECGEEEDQAADHTCFECGQMLCDDCVHKCTALIVKLRTSKLVTALESIYSHANLKANTVEVACAAPVVLAIT